MSIDTRERHILRRLQKLMAAIPPDAPDDDWCAAMTTNQNVLACVLNAQEPFHKTAACFASADKQLDELDHFVTRRQAEKWKAVAYARN